MHTKDCLNLFVCWVIVHDFCRSLYVFKIICQAYNRSFKMFGSRSGPTICVQTRQYMTNKQINCAYSDRSGHPPSIFMWRKNTQKQQKEQHSCPLRGSDASNLPGSIPRPRGYKTFTCSPQLSIIFISS